MTEEKQSSEFGFGITTLEEAEGKQRELIAKTNGVFAEIGHCGDDQLACGVCDECAKEIGG